MSPRLKSALRLVALAGGVGILVALVWSLGPAQVAAVLRQTAPWLPLMILLELAIPYFDIVAARALVGSRADEVSRASWIRSAALAYACGVVLPAGRAAGEAARAAALKDTLGLGPAAAMGARVQTAALVGTSAVSLACAVMCLGTSHLLAGALLGNSVICAAIAIAVSWFVGSRKSLPRAGSFGRASLAACAARAFQVVQYGVALYAAGGAFGLRPAFVAQGVHLVGATVGDFIPNQLGATEGAYRVFDSAVGLEPARAVAIALSIRVAQIVLAGMCWGLVTCTKKET